jgi:soluble lytic murein transglycosylase-like protein
MRLKLAVSCLFGVFFLFVSSGSANIQRSAEAPLRLKLIGQTTAKLASLPSIERAVDKIASLPSAAESFFHQLGAPEPSDVETRDAIDASKDAVPTSLERARTALAESNASKLSAGELCSSLVDVAQANDMPLGFFTNLIWQESRFDHEAISPVGAMGIAQFMPDTAEGMGLGDAFNGREALPASGKLLRTLIERFGNLGLAAAAYNAGPKRVSDWLQQRSGLPKETRDYVSVITGKRVEEWRGVKDKAVVFNVPRQVPCHRTAHFSAVEQAERMAQLQRVEEERQRMIMKAREERRLAATKAREQKRRMAEAKRAKKNKKESRVTTAGGRSPHVAKL